jgi:DinB superfamily/Pentapeptide repeats (8 copies)
MSRFVGSGDFKGAEFIDLDMSAALFREVDLSGARMYGVLLGGADIDGDIRGLRLNGVDVAPLVVAELDRLHPERTKLRPTTPEGMREAWAVVKSIWAETDRRARTLPEADLHRSVNDEWSYADTLRHLVFVTDAWLGQAVVGGRHSFHPLGLPASFITDGASAGIDTQASPTFDEVMAAREDRVAMVGAFLETVTQDDLDRVREPNSAPGGPPPAPRTATSCLHVILNEEWTHRQFAIRDLSIIEAG